MPSIGKLIEIDVRELWKHDQYDFSNWLAKVTNLEYLKYILCNTIKKSSYQLLQVMISDNVN